MQNLVPFAHNWNVGTMENWNIGFWETAAMVYWQNPIDNEVNKMRNFHVKSSFQVRGNTQQPQKTPLILICCRNSETFIMAHTFYRFKAENHKFLMATD